MGGYYPGAVYSVEDTERSDGYVVRVCLQAAGAAVGKWQRSTRLKVVAPVGRSTNTKLMKIPSELITRRPGDLIMRGDNGRGVGGNDTLRILYSGASSGGVITENHGTKGLCTVAKVDCSDLPAECSDDTDDVVETHAAPGGANDPSCNALSGELGSIDAYEPHGVSDHSTCITMVCLFWLRSAPTMLRKMSGKYEKDTLVSNEVNYSGSI